MNLYYNKTQAGIGQVERHVLDTMTRLGKAVIRATDLENELGYSRAISNLVLSRLAKKGWLQRLKSGIYRIVPLGSESATPMPEDAWSIAMELFSPCYISGWTAAEHWELTEQIFNSTVVFTTQKQRKKDIVIAGINYRTKSIPDKDIFGTKKIWSSNTPILIADLHRTIIDALDDPEIGGGGRHTMDIVNAYIKHKEANPEILLQYAEKLDHGSVFKRLGFIAEKIMHLPKAYLNKIYEKIKTGTINLDPHSSNTGPIITKWGIRINIPLGDIL
jgi:predicted transcriptional regulator of viral defense system